MALAPLDASQRRAHKLRNLLQSAILLGGMVVILGLCGWALFGPQGVLGMVLGSALSLLFSPRISPRLVLRLYRARELDPSELPKVFALQARLAERAGLSHQPRLYYIPSRMLNAFAVGRPDDAVIAVTDGLLRSMTLREIAGVLAHETSHIRNNDLWLMGLADLVGRLTRLMTLIGLLLLILAVPLWLGGVTNLPWLVIPLLLFAPQLTTLMELALSRAREFEADLDAAGLTGDPAGLASALAKLERIQRGPLEQLLMPGLRVPEPSLLRSHPPTEDRIARLRDLETSSDTSRQHDQSAPQTPGAPVSRPPRARVLGYWH
ncbi:MAG: zinc metalloprotease HtpX [Pseudomonadota bacterium]